METIITLPRIITRGFVATNRQWYFVHGHDVQQKGFFGHGSIFNEENTFPVPTMYKFCASGARYFMDDDREAWRIVDEAIHRIPIDKPVIVLRKIGQGCSRMEELSPRLYAHMKAQLNQMCYHPISWNYA